MNGLYMQPLDEAILREDNLREMAVISESPATIVFRRRLTVGQEAALISAFTGLVSNAKEKLTKRRSMPHGGAGLLMLARDDARRARALIEAFVARVP